MGWLSILCAFQGGFDGLLVDIPPRTNEGGATNAVTAASSSQVMDHHAPQFLTLDEEFVAMPLPPPLRLPTMMAQTSPVVSHQDGWERQTMP